MKLASVLLGIFVAAAVDASAQTTTWTAATNPHVVSGTYTVPAGQTLVMQPGVVVQINANSRLVINGTLSGQGPAASRITITGATNYDSELHVAGSSNLTFTDVKTKT